MPTYVSLVDFTEKGIHDFKDTVTRSEAAERLAEKFGGSIKSIYWTVGQHDMVVITDMPDEETATAFMLSISSQGNVRTHTLRAFDAAAMRRIIDKTA